MVLKCDAVFQGGGVKGIGLVGAVAAMEKAGYEFQNLAGSSAGAIVSSLLAVGYTSEEINVELSKLDYLKLRQENFLDKFGLPGEVLSVVLRYGIYSADYFESWLESLLRRKNKTRFKDIITDFPEEKYKYRFNAIASDLNDRKMLVLPFDLKKFGYDPDEFSIAKAVRMSMSIPVFFEPFRLKDIDGLEHIIVDGGMLSNYPIWLLDDNSKNPEWPTFGFKFSTDARYEQDQILTEDLTMPIKSIIDYVKSLLYTMLDAHDKFHVSTSSGDYDRTLFIPNKLDSEGLRPQVNTTDFDITRAESDAMFANGYTAAERFLTWWNFEEWVRKYRS